MNTLHFFSLLSIDPYLGKIDKSSLSQQTLMELLIKDITNTKVICGFNEGPTDVSEWNGIGFNDANEITKIVWSCRRLKGPLELQWLPPTTTFVSLSANLFTGTVDLTALPDSLTLLNLSHSGFEGTIDLTNLPEKINYLDLSRNNFWGKTDFRMLPESLEYLNVSGTHLEGEIYAFDGCLEVSGSKVEDMRENE